MIIDSFLILAFNTLHYLRLNVWENQYTTNRLWPKKKENVIFDTFVLFAYNLWTLLLCEWYCLITYEFY